jgi:alpha-tubulin suppressor-like RCC1 family protein
VKAPNSILCFEVGNMLRLKTVWQWVTSQSNNAIETFKTPSTKKNNTFKTPSVKKNNTFTIAPGEEILNHVHYLEL